MGDTKAKKAAKPEAPAPEAPEETTRAVYVAPKREFVDQQAWQQIQTMSDTLMKSQAIPSSIKNAPQLAMVLLAGKEAGMSAMESLNAYYIIDGKLTIYGAAAISQLKRNGFRVEWGTVNEKEAGVTLIDPKGNKHTEKYTLTEAAKAGLTAKMNWQKYPADMLRHKAVGRAIKFFCPEVLSGFYLKEEIEADPGTFHEEAAVTIETETSGPKGGVQGPPVGANGEMPPDFLAPEKKEPIDAQFKPKAEAPAAAKPGLDPMLNKRIHAAWNELARLNGWDEKKAEGVRHQTLQKTYGKASNNDLTAEEADDFVKRINAAIDKKRDEGKPAAGSPEQRVTTCDTCKGIFGEKEKEADFKSVLATGWCVSCTDAQMSEAGI